MSVKLIGFSNFFSVVICILRARKTDILLLLFIDGPVYVYVIFANFLLPIQSLARFNCCCMLTAKIREFNRFAVKRGGQEFSDEDISLVERLLKDNQYSSAGADVLWQMLQWPSGKSITLVDWQ